MRMYAYKAYTNVRSSLWFIPVLCVAVGAMISFSTIALDRAYNFTSVRAEPGRKTQTLLCRSSPPSLRPW